MPEHINGNKADHGKIHPSNRSLRSREMSEVISVKPGFIVNWGMFIMLFMVIAAILLTAFIKVPDTTSMNITLSDTITNDSNRYHGWANVPPKSGEVIRVGQKAYITINDLKDNNITEGKVESIAALSAGKGYRINISFPYSSTINAGSAVAKAAINTGEQSLLNRLFANLVPSFKNKQEK